jgi:hypothetical protein
MACSVFTAQFLLETFFMNGEGRSAVALMTSDGPKSWREMIRNGAVATTESWLTNPKRNMSWAHPWGTAPANIIVRHLFGLRATKPGWEEFVYAPKPSGIENASLRITTPRGLIEASFLRDGVGYKCSLEGGDEAGNPAALSEVNYPVFV